jgi:hypothetical protein
MQVCCQEGWSAECIPTQNRAAHHALIALLDGAQVATTAEEAVRHYGDSTPGALYAYCQQGDVHLGVLAKNKSRVQAYFRLPAVALWNLALALVPSCNDAAQLLLQASTWMSGALC